MNSSMSIAFVSLFPFSLTLLATDRATIVEHADIAGDMHRVAAPEQQVAVLASQEVVHAHGTLHLLAQLYAHFVVLFGQVVAHDGRAFTLDPTTSATSASVWVASGHFFCLVYEASYKKVVGLVSARASRVLSLYISEYQNMLAWRVAYSMCVMLMC